MHLRQTAPHALPAPLVPDGTPIAELSGPPAEIQRKTQELEKLAGLVVAQKKKLSNESFIQRAPAAVVQKERDRLKELEEQHSATAAALAALGGQ